MLANTFLYFHEKIWFNECPREFKHVSYRGYVAEITVLFRSPVHLKEFKNFLNSKHRNIRLSYEEKHDSSNPFLDVFNNRTSSGFKASVYQKPTFSGVY